MSQGYWHRGFRHHDAAFPQRNELEQRVLAGAALVECVLAEEDEEEDVEVEGVRAAVIAGTALEASQLRAADATLKEVTTEVIAGLHKIARRQRERSNFDPVVLAPKQEEALTQTLAQVTSAPDLGQLKAHVGSVLQSMLRALRNSGTALEGVAHDLRCADEETNIVWWLEGRTSRDLKQPWISLKDAVPLMAGWELADLTDVALGPQDASAFLERVLSDAKGESKGQPFEVYVNAVPQNWAKVHAAKIAERALDLAPLSFALVKRSQSNTSSWKEFFEASCGMKVSTVLGPDLVARQAYVEAMLLRVLADAKD